MVNIFRGDTCRSSRAVLAVSALAISLLNVACSRNAGPGANDLGRHIQAQLPSDLKLHEFKHQNYADKTRDGVGRSSVSGTVELTVERYIPSSTVFRDDLLASGLAPSEADFFSASRGSPVVFVPSEPSGKLVQFSTDIDYEATVDGFRLYGGPRFQFGSSQNAHEVRSANSLVKNTPAYRNFLNETIALRDAYVRNENDRKAAVEKFFSTADGYAYLGIEDWNKNSFLERFKMSLTEPLRFQKTGVNETTFAVRATAAWTTDGRLANSHFKAGERTPLLLSGRISGTIDRNNTIGPFYVELIVNVPDEHRGGFYNTSDTLYLQGTEFIFKPGVSGMVGGRLVRG